MPEQMYNGMGEGGEGIELLQVACEWEPIAALYLERQPRRVLEIGSWHGGTLKFWLEHATPNAVVCALDIVHRNRGWYDGWKKQDTTLHVAEHDSTSDEGKAWIYSHAPYDWAIIDGDHSEGAARSDAETCLTCMNPGSVLLFHDIQPPRFGGEVADVSGPGVVYQQLRAELGCESREFIDGEWHDWTHGMGVLFL